jgi:peptidoglycan/xylan/chitin deacetylase (PgdA/CDA1 family)
LIFITAVFGGVFFYLSRTVDISVDPGIPVPIIMYHSIQPAPKRIGEFVISPKQFESDVEYIEKNGYTTVVIGDLIDYVYKGTPLPQKPIVLTFDDGQFDNCHYALPILKKHGMKAVMSVVGSYTDEASKTGKEDPVYTYITWNRLAQIVSSNVFEVQNHTYNLHLINKSQKGAGKKRGESNEAYKIRLKNDVGKMQNKIYEETGRLPDAFTYPFGEMAKTSNEILKEMGFKSTISCIVGVNKISVSDPDCLFSLKRFLRSGKDNTQRFFTAMEKRIK